MRKLFFTTVAAVALLVPAFAFGQSNCFPLETHEKGLKELHGEELAWSATIEDEDTGKPMILRFYANPTTRAWTLTVQPREGTLVTCPLAAGFDFRSYPGFAGRGA